MQKNVITIVALFSCWLHLACLNIYYPNTKGEYFNMGMEIEDSLISPSFSHYELSKDSVAQSKKLLKFKPKTTEYNKHFNDLGVILIKMGHLAEAEKVFLQIEQNQPYLYSTASNLGTAYELMGQNEKALYWISEGIKRNANAHEGSEWIHVKILEAKIALQRDPNYLKTHTVLGTDFGNEILPVYIDAPSALNMPKLGDLIFQLSYQLKERTHFIKKDDPIMGQLFFDLGNVRAIIANFKSAQDAYQYVRQYGYKTAVSEKRIQYINSFRAREMIPKGEKYDFKANPPEVILETEETGLFTYVLLGFMMVLSCTLVIFSLRSYGSTATDIDTN